MNGVITGEASKTRWEMLPRGECTPLYNAKALADLDCHYCADWASDGEARIPAGSLFFVSVLTEDLSSPYHSSRCRDAFTED